MRWCTIQLPLLTLLCFYYFSSINATITSLTGQPPSLSHPRCWRVQSRLTRWTACTFICFRCHPEKNFPQAETSYITLITGSDANRKTNKQTNHILTFSNCTNLFFQKVLVPIIITSEGHRRYRASKKTKHLYQKDRLNNALWKLKAKDLGTKLALLKLATPYQR